MRISLIDVDSKIPNLALMKISAYHKAKGDVVGFNLYNPDKIYTSIIFTKNNGKALNQRLSDGIKFEFGGSGINYKWLPDKIEFIKPDYDLYNGLVCQKCGSTKGNCSCKHKKYGGIYFSMGYTTRGCNRKCYFCIVHKKEGRFKRWQHPDDFYCEHFNQVKLMDNSILWDKMWTQEVLNYFIDKDVDVDMTQGYDIRLVDEDVADLILRSTKGIIRFAFDDTKIEPIIREKIELLKDVGFDIRNKVQFYCYCHNDSMHDDTLYRCKVLKNLGTNAFVMYNCDKPRTSRIRNLIYWCNRKVIYWSIPYEEYYKKAHT